MPGIVGRDGQSKTFGNVLTFSPERKENAGKPGPGTYDGNSIITKNKDPQYKLGTS